MGYFDNFDEHTVSEPIGHEDGNIISQRLRRRAEGYVITPAAWHCVLNQVTYAPTLQIARHLLAIGGGRYDGRKLYFTRWDAGQLNIGRDARYRALRELQDLGLIILHKSRGSAFLVTLLRTD